MFHHSKRLYAQLNHYSWKCAVLTLGVCAHDFINIQNSSGTKVIVPHYKAACYGLVSWLYQLFSLIYKNLTVPSSLIVVCFMATCFPKKAQVLYEKSNVYIAHWITILPIHPIYILLSWKHFIFWLLDTSYWLQKWKNIKQFILHLQLPEKEKYSSSFINSFLI